MKNEKVIYKKRFNETVKLEESSEIVPYIVYGKGDLKYFVSYFLNLGYYSSRNTIINTFTITKIRNRFNYDKI